MSCGERENVFLLIQQMLGPDESERMRRHLAHCAECARAAEEYRRLDSALDDWAVAEPSPWFDARVRRGLRRTRGRNPGFSVSDG